MAKEAKKPTDDEVKERLRRVIASYHPTCLGHDGSKLSKDREALKRAYLGHAYPNDEKLRKEGWSTYIDRAVLETVEWAKPSLLRTFGSGQEIIRFDPRGPEDEATAKDATNYVNTVFARNGFELVHSAISDALMQRVGWAVADYDKHDEELVDEYAGLTPEEATAVLMDAGVQLDRAEVKTRPADDADPRGPQVIDLTTRRTKTVREIKLLPVPSENVIIEQNARSIETCRFIAHWEDRMISELVKEGYDKDILADLPRVTGSQLTDQGEKRAELETNSEAGDVGREDDMDTSTALVRVYEAYTFTDLNGDGTAERVKVVYVSPDNDDANPIILKWEEWTMRRPPIFAACSVPLAHSVIGLSLADLVADLQKLKSELTRYYLDNLYLNNQGEIVISKGDTRAKIDLDGFLSRRPGGVYEVEGAVNVTPLPINSTGDVALAGLEMANKSREVRTGVGQNLMGVQSPDLQGTATGASILEEQINQRLELISRVIAEQFFKPLGKYILELAQKYQDKPARLRLHGRFALINPRAFDLDWDVSVAVGLGTGNKAKQAAGIGQIMQLQQTMMEKLGGASPVKLHMLIDAAHKFAESQGFESPERFFGTEQDALICEKMLAQQQAQAAQGQQSQDPNVIMAQIEQRKQALAERTAAVKARLDQAKFAQDTAIKQQNLQATIAMKQNELALEHGLKEQEIESDAQLDALELALKHGERQAPTVGVNPGLGNPGGA